MGALSVRSFHSGMAGAPQLSGTAGAKVALLDACLKDGFGLVTINSLVIASNVATATITAGHSAEVGSVVTIAGATISGGGTINTDFRVLTKDTTHVTFATTGISDQTATGTPTMKIAGLGWTKQWSATNKATYKSSDGAALGHVLNVDDSGTIDARVAGFESMTGPLFSDGTAPFPTTAQFSGGLYWHKSRTADSVTKPWFLVGDERAFYLFVAYEAGSAGYYQGYFFGDFLPLYTADAYATLLTGAVVSATSENAFNGVTNLLAYSDPQNAMTGGFVPRAHTGVGSSAAIRKHAPCLTSTNLAGYSGASGHVVAYPNNPNQGLVLSPILVSSSNGTSWRGQLPGIYYVPQSVPAGTFATRDEAPAISWLAGRSVKAVLHGNDSPIFIDTTGPWR